MSEHTYQQQLWDALAENKSLRSQLAAAELRAKEAGEQLETARGALHVYANRAIWEDVGSTPDGIFRLAISGTAHPASIAERALASTAPKCELLRCVACGLYTTQEEARLRKFNEGRCGNCGGQLTPIPTAPKPSAEPVPPTTGGEEA